MDKNLTVNKLEDDSGAQVFHINFKMSGLMGLMVSDRAFYIALWDEKDENSQLTIDTTEGNKHIEEANKATTGKNVLGTVHVEYFKVSWDSDNVCRFLKIHQAHAGGNLPRGTKLPTKAVVDDAKKDIERMVDYIANMIEWEGLTSTLDIVVELNFGINVNIKELRY